ncbi:MAG: hypothetical protein K9I85_15890 [Saprospiraceae bacterium]|nr:hypothetical protein [Saprospiraceae bacterium]
MDLLQVTLFFFVGLLWVGCSDSGQHSDENQTPIIDTVIVEGQDTVIHFDPDTYAVDTYYTVRYDTMIVTTNASD